ncbi:MAG: bifunctional aspartate kinase/homoserine dehydrogenase I, partial [Cyclobacteriaceae bacterium]|nr:bifunctional aspartate kinase/homoserine dehydrogenase I [Cyclobacteriaceae bacterium]
MLVLKFGGTSMATSESMQNVKDIVLERSGNEDVIVVVSALGGITNLLNEAGSQASKGEIGYSELLKEVETRHIQLASSLIAPAVQGSTMGKIKLHINKIEDICKGIFWIKEITNKTNDYLLSFGEVLSSLIFSDYLNSINKKNHLADPRLFIKTDS